MRIKLSLLALAGFSVASAANAQGPDFEKDIWPFINKSCVSCHQPEHKDERGRTRRPKGDLVITNKEAFLKGGEGGAVIVAAKPEDSPFLNRTKLPLDHDDHMPPEGKADQWTDAQKKLFEDWIKAGANFGAWTRDAAVDKK